MGKVITTHLVDGNPRGIRSVFISNKICNMYIIPRGQMSEAHANEDIQLEQVAFYMLLGGEGFLDLPKAYIGQTGNFKERVKSHEGKKEFWDTAFVFIAKDNSLTTVEVQYLEASAMEKAKKVNSYDLDENRNQPTPPNLPPHLKDTVSEFWKDIELLTAFVGCRIFSSDTDRKKSSSGEQYFFLKGRGGDAKGSFVDGRMTVLAGSVIAPDNTPMFSGKERRDEMVRNLTEEKDGKKILRINKEFSSPSAAAQFVFGRSSNGWDEWKDAKGKPLKTLRAKE